MRLLVGGELYDPLASEALLERQYGRIIEQRASLLFPEYLMVPFTPVLESDHGRAQPDYALIHVEYRTWWVVEIELSHHSLEGHVLPQVAVFANASYAEREADLLAGADARLDRVRLLDMVKGEPPKILVIADESRSLWPLELARYGAYLCVIQVFRSRGNDHLLRVNGYQPEPPGDTLSRCRVVPLIPQMLKVDSPAGLPEEARIGIDIFVGGELSRWKRVDTADGVWLAPERTSPIDPSDRLWDLIRHEDGRLILQTLERRRLT
jgi:hypothetical protein